MRLPTSSVLALLGSGVLIACGGSSDATPYPTAPMDAGNPFGADVGAGDAGASQDSGLPAGYPALKPDMPQVVHGSGPVMLAPKFVAITFQGDAFQTQIADFVSTVGQTDYWASTVTEYGSLSAATGMAVPPLTEKAPASIDDSAVGPWLAQKIANAILPAPTADTLYTIFYPASTIVTLQGSTSCQQFGGYHNESTTNAGVSFSYAVIPRCASFGAMTGIDVITGSASHEFIEATTDPLPQSDPAYGQVDNDHIIWEVVLGGGEIGDLCAQDPRAFYKPSGFAYTVQRTWSNKSALAGHDPCVPNLPGPYFNSAPVLVDALTLSGNGGGSLATKGASIALGKSKAIEFDLYSDAPTSGAWTAKLYDSVTLTGGGAANLSFSPSVISGKNGDTAHVTVTVKSAGQYGFESFVVVNELGQTGSYWVGMVSN